jgi:hypothetical protein
VNAARKQCAAICAYWESIAAILQHPNLVAFGTGNIEPSHRPAVARVAIAAWVIRVELLERLEALLISELPE